MLLQKVKLKFIGVVLCWVGVFAIRKKDRLNIECISFLLDLGVNIEQGPPVPLRNSLGDGEVWNFTGATPSPARRPDKHPLNVCGVSLPLADYCLAGTSLLHSPDRRPISAGCLNKHSQLMHMLA